MRKIVITLETDASLLLVNKDFNKIINELLTGNFIVKEYTIQEGK